VVGSDTLGASGSLDRDGNSHLGSNNTKRVAFYDRTKDQMSYALNFNGGTDYVNADDSNSLDLSSSMTFEAWIYPRANTVYDPIIGKVNSGYADGYEFANSSTNLRMTLYQTAVNYCDYQVAGLTVNEWQHVAGTFDGNNIKLYRNGALIGTSSTCTYTATVNATALNIARRVSDGQSFDGIIDETAIFNTVRTATQIQNDYNARRLTDNTTGLVGLWHFDEGQGTRAYDSSGNNNHGTLTNMATTAWVNSQNDRDQSALSQQTLGIDPNWGNGVSRKNYSLSYDGTGDYLTTSVNSDFTFGTNESFTVDFWIYPLDVASGRYYLSNSGAVDQFGLGYWGPTTQWVINLAGSQYTISDSLYQTNRWYHIALVRNGGTVRLYKDGVQTGSDISASGATSPSGSLIIGYYNLGANYPAYGYIDEFRISKGVARYTTAFTPSRRIVEDSNDKLLLHFDEGIDNTCSGGTNDACDSSSAAHDTAINGNPTWVTDARAIMDNNSRYISLGANSSSLIDKGLEIYTISTTQFKYRWTGDQTWSSAVNFSSYPFASPAQLGTTGVYVGFDTTNGTFGDESYFLIPSWAIQQFSSTRGARRSFPERSYLVATDRGADIIDADDNTLWMRVSNGDYSGQLLGVQTNNVPSSVLMAQGQLLIATNGSAGTGVYRLDFNRDTAYRYNATNRTTGNNNLAKRNNIDWSWGSADTGQNLIDSIVNDVSLLVINGKCVAGDTKLRRRRRKNGKWVYDEVSIDSVEVGDEILSLNEETGKFEWQVIEAKKMMGVKPTWQIVTESGRKIRATHDHRFLTQATYVSDPNYIQKQTLEYSEALARQFYFTYLSGRKTLSPALKDNVMFTHSGWNHFEEKSRSINELITRYFALTRVRSVIKHADKVADYEKRIKPNMTIEYWSLEAVVESILTKVVICSINGGQKFFLSCVWKGEQKNRGVKLDNKKELSLSAMPRRRELVIPQLFSDRSISNSFSNVKWSELKDIAIGQFVVTDNGLEQVVSIKRGEKETVWDIQVSQNHNFVGNGLVAHNCMLATANNTGLTKIANIMSNDTSYDYSDVTSNAYNRVRVAENYVSGTGAVGDMYALNSTNNALERWNNVVADSANETNGTPDATVNATSTPALFASAQTVNDLDVKTGTSLANAGNNTVFVGHNGGTTMFQENRGTLASSSVKYLTKDYIGEEMVGDIKGMWPFYENSGSTVADISKNNISSTAIGTSIVTGIRGKARSFAGSSSHKINISTANIVNGVGNFTLSLWAKVNNWNTQFVFFDVVGGTHQLEFGTYDRADGKVKIILPNDAAYSFTTTMTNTNWAQYTLVRSGASVSLYENGNFVETITGNSTTMGTTSSQYLGIAYDGINYPFNGQMDEVVLMGTALSATQIQQMYVAGKEALNNKYRTKLASDTVNQLAGTTSITKGVAASDNYIFAGTNGASADDGILSRVLSRGDVTDKTYDESTTDPLIVDNDINSVAVSRDGAYIIVGTDDQGVTIIHNGSATNRLRSGGKVQGPSKRPSN
jgi:hypothetical protein